MKNIGICYLLFIILLSIMPCADDNKVDGVDGQSIAAVNHQDDFGADSCSPICLCVCCGQTLVTPTPLDFRVNVLTAHRSALTISHEDDLQKRAYSIWQPPKLS